MISNDGLLRSGETSTGAKCNRDCFNCVYDDCIVDDVEYEEIQAQDKLDKKIESMNELVEPEVLRMRESVKKYKHTEKGKETNRKYERTEKAKARRLRYYSTEKGMANLIKQREKQRKARERARNERREQIDRIRRNCGYDEESYKQFTIFDL